MIKIILQHLVDYAEKFELPPATMYERMPVPWIVELDETGNLIDIKRTGSEQDRGDIFTVPVRERTSGIKPVLLVDYAEYALGVKRDSKTRKRHESFIECIQECFKKTKENDIKAVLNFLHNKDINTINLPEAMAPKDRVGFTVDGRHPWDKTTVKEFWKNKFIPDEKENQKMECIICGNLCTPISPHPISIKGIPGGQSQKALISANTDVFESYGLEQSEIAPTCIDCAVKYASALNNLIWNGNTSRKIGSVIFVYWTKEGEDCEMPVNTLFNASTENVNALFDSPQSGRNQTEIDHSLFYAMTLSASGARVVVRNYSETTVANIKKNLKRWFMMQKITPWGNTDNPYSIYYLTAVLCPRQEKRERQPLFRYINENMDTTEIPNKLFKAAIYGEKLPLWLLNCAVLRNKVEQDVPRARAVLIKMVLLSQGEEVLGTMEGLNKNNENPAYLCGRLFAVLENIQKSAVAPGSNQKLQNSISARFFGSASTAPASVFGQLLRNAQNHLNKLKKDKPGTYRALEGKLEEIHQKMHCFPDILNFKEQGMFALGYYHQRASDHSDAIEAKNNKEHSCNEISND